MWAHGASPLPPHHVISLSHGVLGLFEVIVGVVGQVKNLPEAQTTSDVVWALSFVVNSDT